MWELLWSLVGALNALLLPANHKKRPITGSCRLDGITGRVGDCRVVVSFTRRSWTLDGGWGGLQALGRDPVVTGRIVAVGSAMSVVAGFNAIGPEHGLTSHMLGDREGKTMHPFRAHILRLQQPHNHS